MNDNILTVEMKPYNWKKIRFLLKIYMNNNIWTVQMKSYNLKKFIIYKKHLQHFMILSFKKFQKNSRSSIFSWKIMILGYFQITLVVK